MKILYYDCFSGISGDMHLGALIDAGVEADHLINELNKLPLSGFRLTIEKDRRKSIEGTRVDVVLEEGQDQSAHKSNDAGSHKHDHSGKQDDKSGHHHDVHRTMKDIEAIIHESKLPDATKSRAMKMFRVIAEAEARVHGIPVDKVHFHEVGAVDSIVDITGAAIGLEFLNPDRILCSTIELGSGMVKCAHGLMPVPAPATSEILKHIPVKLGSVDHEATTPTGAAILAANVDQFTDLIRFRTIRTAYGIGQRDTETPNVLRIFVGELEEDGDQKEDAVLIECNLDDMNPELHSHVMDTLFDHGVYDVFITPVIMKKNRPAVILSVLCSTNDEESISELLLQHTTTLGVRKHPVSRTMLHREQETVTTSLGPVTIKKAWHKGTLLKWKPEYEDCKKLADKHRIPLQEVYKIVESETDFTQKSDP